MRHQYRIAGRVTAFAKLVPRIVQAIEATRDAIKASGQFHFEALPAHAKSADPVRATLIWEQAGETRQCVARGALESDAAVNAMARALPFDMAFDIAPRIGV